ncbi:MAG TPA: NAD(P)-binding protein, partial [Methyloceanibacter sp.]|nr:NAD(P)-binding protein [Methyloceanibacter sp.]
MSLWALASIQRDSPFGLMCYPGRGGGVRGKRNGRLRGDSVKRYCIIGAGACGLVVAKTFTERGIPFDCFEALVDVGGIWNPES